MTTNATKDAVRLARDIADAEGDDDAWIVLRILFGALVAGRERALADVVWEWERALAAGADDGRQGA